MVKKGQPKGGKPGSGTGTKTPASPGPDDSFIVFSNSDKEPKQRKPTTGPTGSSSMGLDGPALAGEAPKRPDVKKLIGGASWTGKLPVNMLSEHCQKQRWEKPEYTMVRGPVSAECLCLMIPSANPFHLLDQNPRRILFNGHHESQKSKDARNGPTSSI